MKTMKDYHNLYLRCHVFLLADVFDKFGNNSFRNYLCPSYYLSATDLSCNAMLKITKIKLELTQYPDMKCIYSLKEVQEMEFLIFLTGIA